MPPSMLANQLRQIGNMLNRWSAELRMTFWISTILLSLWVFAWLDFALRFSQTGRFTAWAVLISLGVVALVRFMKELSRPRTPEAVAVSVEQSFPQLDNHLINLLQFSASVGNDPFKAAYIKMAVPHWNGLDFKAMKDRRRHRRVQILLISAVLLMLAPLPVIGNSWTVALWRIVNPFSKVSPVTLTQVLTVTPGNTTILQGGSVTLACQVKGRRGHEVWLDVKPADSALRTYSLGMIRGAGVEGFSNTVHKVTTAMEYRFRAGDAFTPDWYTIELRPPLAVNSMALEVVPPAYTAIPPARYDAQSTAITVPAGSVLNLVVICNAALTSLSVSNGAAAMAMAPRGDARTWAGSMTVTNGAGLVLEAQAAGRDSVAASLNFEVIPDKVPVIEVISPRQPITLMPGSSPKIDFRVSDDFGLDDIVIQRVPDQESKDVPPEILKTYKWVTGKNMDFTTLWTGEARQARQTGNLVFRIVARDKRPGGANVATSAPITFVRDSMDKAAKKREELEQATLRDLNRVIALQRANIEQTKKNRAAPGAANAEAWTAAAGVQKEIRTVTKELLEKGGGRCLGNLVEAVKKLYAHEMGDVIPLLEGIATAKTASDQAKQAGKALSMEEKILRFLTFGELAVAQSKIEARNTALVGMLSGIIRGEEKVMRATSLSATQSVALAETLVRDQDSLGSDMVAFIAACGTEGESSLKEDKDYAAFLTSVVTFCKGKNIRGDMVLAAEQLEKKNAAAALVKEHDAHRNLIAALKMFDEMRAKNEKEKTEEMIEALQSANKKIEKLKALEKKLVEAMEAVKEFKGKDTKKLDAMEEDFKEIQKNIEEALMQVPKDLDIFTEQNPANDLVEDIMSTFEEVTQAPGSENADPNGVKELAVAKREGMLEGMEKAAGNLDALETWLKKAPDALKINTEPFDKEEMPPGGIAAGPLRAKVEEITSDLLNESKDLQSKDQDGAINSATPDMQPDGPCTEGDVANFSAKGQSGNETPDHKEQDGRSNVGRQGMASGENASGSGKIGKGDDNIEARRTQDPTSSGQVNLEGEAKTKATGGGKLGTGKADGFGQGGGKDRMDSKEAGSREAMAAMMSKVADATYAEASMKGVRTASFKSAAHHIRQLNDAIAKGAPIDQVAELKRKALGDLKKAKTELSQDNAGDLGDSAGKVSINDVVDAGPEEAPPKYRDMVSDYFKKLGESL